MLPFLNRDDSVAFYYIYYIVIFLGRVFSSSAGVAKICFKKRNQERIVISIVNNNKKIAIPIFYGVVQL